MIRFLCNPAARSRSSAISWPYDSLRAVGLTAGCGLGYGLRDSDGFWAWKCDIFLLCSVSSSLAGSGGLWRACFRTVGKYILWQRMSKKKPTPAKIMISKTQTNRSPVTFLYSSIFSPTFMELLIIHTHFQVYLYIYNYMIYIIISFIIFNYIFNIFK